MAKKRMRIKIRIPPYVSPRNHWRRKIHSVVAQEDESKGVRYTIKDRIELEVLLYFNESALSFHDVDNRLKDVMDALQGRVGGSKATRTLDSIIPNDRQIFKVTVEKKRPPGQSKGAGHLTIRRHNDSK
jgi:Holliday junction resolvase RusA-like endonuclease